jgi:hypothetical protein
METDKAISINFTDLQDTPNTLDAYSGCIITVSPDAKNLICSNSITLNDLVNHGNTDLKGGLDVLGSCQIFGDTTVKKIQSSTLVSETVYCDNMQVSGNTMLVGLQTKSLQTDDIVSQSLKCQNIESSKVKCMDMETDNLTIHKDLYLPSEVNISSLNVNTLKVLETSYLNKVLSTEHTSVSLNSNSGLITDLTSVNALVVDMKATKIESDEIVASSIHHKTIDIDGSPDIPDMKDPDGGYFQRSITSSKYVWYGKLKTSSNSIKFKLNTPTANVLSQVIPRISFHAYSLGSFDLKPSFKYDTQIFPNQNDDTSFFVNVNFSDNLPLVAKFIFSIVLEKV